MKKIDRSIIYYLFSIVTYIALVLLLPANTVVMQNYHLSSTEYHLLLLAVILPYIGIWYAAFYGVSHMRRFASLVKPTTEGPQFSLMARGFNILAWSLPIAAISSICLNTYANSNPGFHSVSVIVNNYIALVLPLLAFVILRQAASGLLKRSRLTISRTARQVIALVFLLLGAAYAYVTVSHLDMSRLGDTDNPFFLPAWLVLLTLTIPFLMSWFSGLIAAFEIFIFSKNSAGLLYRRALIMLAVGVLAVIISAVALQYMTAVSPRRGYLTLNAQLVVTYAIRLCSAIGYVLIAVGALQLRRIEEV